MRLPKSLKTSSANTHGFSPTFSEDDLKQNRLDQIIVIDLEATCWETPKPPPGQEREIIEIGICTLDVVSGERLAKRSILVKPERSTISAFCTQLTTLTQEQVMHEGVSFKKACSILKKEYLSDERMWASYGDYDRAKFEKQCRLYKVSYPFGPRHLNIKSLFGLMNGIPREIGLEKAMGVLNLPMEGTHHRGHDDAWNAAAILSTLMLRGRPS
ncbi:MAG: DNA polymerase III [Chloroflexi bacterium]|nr:DNA polymerase III [Chloroflexota bacterium]